MPLQTVVNVLNCGGISVIPTDTIYGIVAKASDRSAVSRLYRLRRKTPARHNGGERKPFVILIHTLASLQDFGIRPSSAQRAFLKKVWPGKVSVILSCPSKRFSYLHLGTKTLAFRLPRPKQLQSLLKKTGPLVAPSANPEGKKPAETIAAAKKYFGEAVDIYVGIRKKFSGKPSTLVSLLTDTPVIVREGAVRIRGRKRKRHPLRKWRCSQTLSPLLRHMRGTAS